MIRLIKSHATWVIFLLSFLPDMVVCFGNGVFLATGGYMLEDGFYYLTIARNFVTGNGLTLDGVHWTNGFQPLFIVALLPGAAVCGTWQFVRYSLLVCALCKAGAAVGIYSLLKRTTGFAAAFAAALIWACAASTRHLLLNGMDTALFLLLLVWTIHFYLRVRNRPVLSDGTAYALGVLLGLTCLSRTDGFFLAPVIACDLLITRMKQATAPLARMAATAIIVTAPWLFYGWIVVGSIIPDSGPASKYLAHALGDGFLEAAWSNGAPPAYAAAQGSATLFFLRRFLMLGFAGWAWTPPVSLQLGCEPATFLASWRDYPLAGLVGDAGVLPSAIVCALALSIWTALRSRQETILLSVAILLWLFYAWLPGPPWFAIRYMAPMILANSVLIATGITRALRHCTKSTFTGAALAIVYLAACGLQYRGMFPRPIEPGGYLGEALWIRDNTPKNAVVASFQAGVMSYFSERRVINLDGVVNRSALEALRKRRMLLYLHQNKVDYVADGKGMLDTFLGREAPLHHSRNMVRVKEGFFHVYRLNKGGPGMP